MSALSNNPVGPAAATGGITYAAGATVFWDSPVFWVYAVLGAMALLGAAGALWRMVPAPILAPLARVGLSRRPRPAAPTDADFAALPRRFAAH